MQILEEKIGELSLLLAGIDWNDLAGAGRMLTICQELEAGIPEEMKGVLTPLTASLASSLGMYIMREFDDKSKAEHQIERQVEALQNAVSEIAATGNCSVNPVPAESGAPGGEGPSAVPAMPEDQQKELIEYTASNIGTIDELESKFLDLEQNGTGPALINEIFRIVHTLKSETGFAGLQNVSALCHHMESIFSILRQDPVTLESAIIDVLLESKDGIRDAFSLCSTDVSEALSLDFGGLLDALRIFKEQLATAVSKGEAPAEKQVASQTAVEGKDIERLVLSEIDDPSIYTDFISEALEHLDVIEHKLLELESEPEDTALLNDIFRPLHTIKGVSAFLGLNHINHLSHDAETFLDLARNGVFIMDNHCIDLVFEVVDCLKRLIDTVTSQLKGQTIDEGEYPDVYGLIDTITETIKTKKRGGGSLTRETAEPGKKIGEILVEENMASADDVDAALARQKETGGEKKLGEILIEEKKVSPRQMSSALRKQKEGTASQETETIKINTKKLDDLLDIVGELVISQTLIAQDPRLKDDRDSTLAKNIAHSNKIVRDIQDISMGLRMIPIKQTFLKMTRLVRDLANKSGKQVVLEISGAETELDRNVIEQINDPLVHMIRNSVDHGIEDPETRTAAGKKPTGRIHLNAYQQGGNIVIEIEDDGKGLNKEAIRNKAIEKKLISASDTLTDEELYGLVFAPGFSTAAMITDVSGRGVGMDVVKKNIEKLGGNVSIDSRPGEGSLFTIRLPLTMAIMDGMILQVGQEKYLLPVLSIQESIRPKPGDTVTVQGKGEMVKVRGNLIQLIRIHELFGIEPEAADPSNAIVIIVDLMGRSLGLMADRLLGQQQVVIKRLKFEFGDVKGVSGSAILGNGRVGLILDLKGLVELSRSTEHSSYQQQQNGQSGGGRSITSEQKEKGAA